MNTLIINTIYSVGNTKQSNVKQDTRIKSSLCISGVKCDFLLSCALVTHLLKIMQIVIPYENFVLKRHPIVFGSEWVF